jgi:Protein of unknown function (DUF4127)
LTGSGNTNSTQYYDATTNKLEFARLNTAIQMIKQNYPKIKIEVVGGFGDTTNKLTGSKILSKLQSQLDSMLVINGIDKTIISTGADELVSQAIASQLTSKNIRTYISNPSFENHYDARKTTYEITSTKITQSNLKNVLKGNSPDLFAYILTPGDEGTLVELEKIAMEIFELKKKNPFVESKIAFIDSLKPNGSTVNPKRIKKIFDKYNIDFGRITFGSWGTGGNVIGDTLARLKVQNNLSENRKSDTDIEKIRAARYQAFAHDFIILNKSLRPELKQAFIEAGINFDPTNPRLNYDLLPKEKSKQVKEILEKYVNKKMIEVFGKEVSEKYYFKLSYGFRRLFEINIQAIDLRTKSPVL